MKVKNMAGLISFLQKRIKRPHADFLISAIVAEENIHIIGCQKVSVRTSDMSKNHAFPNPHGGQLDDRHVALIRQILGREYLNVNSETWKWALDAYALNPEAWSEELLFDEPIEPLELLVTAPTNSKLEDEKELVSL